MKKGSSIFISMLILLSGMHLSMAVHTCQDEVVAVKWSFSGKLAGCGMEVPVNSCPVHEGISTNCCHDVIAYLSVDNNYSHSAFQVTDVTGNILQVYAVPVSTFAHTLQFPISSHTNASPPDREIANAVSLAGICVFRI